MEEVSFYSVFSICIKLGIWVEKQEACFLISTASFSSLLLGPLQPHDHTKSTFYQHRFNLPFIAHHALGEMQISYLNPYLPDPSPEKYSWDFHVTRNDTLQFQLVNILFKNKTQLRIKFSHIR